MSRKRKESRNHRGMAEAQSLATPASRVATGPALQLADKRLVLGIALGVLLATLLLYVPIFGHPFTNYDDPLYITENAHVQAGLSPEAVGWALTTFHASNWHPLTWLLHEFDYQVFGGQAGGHHFVSALLHALNAALLFLLLSGATGAMGRSLVVSLLFAFHPLNVESVAWAAELKTVLCTFFFLLGLGFYGWYSRNPGVKRFAPVIVCFALSLASKPLAITFPFVLLLLDYWPLGRVKGWTTESVVTGIPQKSPAQLVLEKLPLLALCIASAVVTVAAQQTTGSVVSTGAISGITAPISMTLRIQNALNSYGAYLWKGIWPSGLVPFYPFPFAGIPAWNLALAALLLVTLTAISWKFRHREPSLLVGWLFYLGTLVPMVGLVQVGGQAMADRYAYLPLIGIFVFAVWGLTDLAASWKFRAIVPATIGALALVPFAALTWQQEQYWQSNYALWTHTLAVAPDNPTAEHNISIDLMQRGLLPEALGHLQNSVRIDPMDVVSRINLAVNYQNQERYAEAIQQYELVLQQTKDTALLPVIYENLGNIYHAMGDFAKSEESYQSALRISPGRASTLAKLQDLRADREISGFAQSVTSHPSAGGYLQLGRMLRQANWIPEARDAYQKALTLDPSLQAARAELAALPPDNAAMKSN